MKIGVFDSGVGGLSIANAIRAEFPEDTISLREDKEHLPYGNRHPDELLELVKPILQELVDKGCRVIVVACNTVTTTIINDLRERFPVPIVAVEPMVKPAAAMTKSGVIAICATPATLSSSRYAELKSEYAQHVKVLEPDCSDWALMIEHDRVDHQILGKLINEVLADGADVIVLACTHYHWIEAEINKLVKDKAVVLQPETALIAQLRRVLEPLR